MNSSGLNRIMKEFGNWQPFTEENVKGAPQEKGVYVVRQASGKPFGRLDGESDILYIGSATSGGGLRQRILHYFHPGPTQWTSQRINGFLKKYQMEIAWYPCAEPTNLEHDLLRQYLSDHDELPPFNHADSRRLREPISEQIGLTDKLSLS